MLFARDALAFSAEWAAGDVLALPALFIADPAVAVINRDPRDF
jgi:hypothetical protein